MVAESQYTKFGTFFDSDVATISAATTYSTEQPSVSTDNKNHISVQMKATGGTATSSGDVVFNFSGKVFGSSVWDTVYVSDSISLDGTSTVAKSGFLDTRDYEYFRISSIENKDSADEANDVNVYWASQRIGAEAR